jgi:hypothetical protein
MSVMVLHFVAGAVAGAMFTVRMLLALVAIIVVAGAAVTILGGFTAGLHSVAGLIAVQIGYLAGVYLRGALERVGIAHPAIRPSHQR